MSAILTFVSSGPAPVASFGDSGGEESVVVAAKNGSDEAFETLVERYRHRIVATALRFTRVQEDAEDIAQQCFQKAFVHLHTFEGKSAFSTWLTRIAVNEALMFLRRSRGQLKVSIQDDFADVEGATSRLEIPDSDPDPEVRYLQREKARILAAAMQELRPRLRKAIELRELAELSTEETARRMGLSVGAVKARIFHGRRKLRKALRRYMRPRRMSTSNNFAIAGDLHRNSGRQGSAHVTAIR